MRKDKDVQEAQYVENSQYEEASKNREASKDRESSKYREAYSRRIHAVQDYIEEHIEESISIEQLSQVAGFSKFHFSRIFQAVLNETLAHYIARIRLERAQFLLAHRLDKNMTDIAYEVGFSDSAVFSRAYHNYFDISPREYRKQYGKICKESICISDYNVDAMEQEQRRKGLERATQSLDRSITIEHIETMQAVYVRHTGNYAELAKKYDSMLQTLLQQASKRQLIVGEENWILAMYHDNPEFGDEKQYRTSICMTVPDSISIQEDEVLGTMQIEGGLYVVGHFRILPKQYAAAWDTMYREWIVGKGYVPRKTSPFEVYRNNPAEEPDHLNIVDIYLPVEKNPII